MMRRGNRRGSSVLAVVIAALLILLPAGAGAQDFPPLQGEEQLAENLRRTPVYYRTNLPAGSIVVDVTERYLYLVLGRGHALRYGVAVGKEGYEWEGMMRVTRKREWPDWRPTKEMRQRDPRLPEVVKGGPNNPLGARALYLGWSEYRIHGTTQPKSIGTAASSGCIRMLNEHVIDLYKRVRLMSRVVVTH